MRIEKTILSQLLINEDYSRVVIPFLKKEYFNDRLERILAEEIVKFFNSYNKLINKEILSIEISNRKDVSDQEIIDIKTEIEELTASSIDFDWLIKRTEEFCKRKAVYNAILKSIGIINGEDKNFKEDSIPHLLTDALSVCFDRHVGHDFLEDSDSRYDFYHKVEERLPFDLEFFNKITGGGLPKKTLNVALAGCVHPSTKVRIRFRKKE